ncbi:MAG: 5-formyltetrahydrofolate cyclo-ligase [Spirochaetaceae bacterium]|nr:5-formyltetrahydrofolate cyclo-ligase [Spirochaetaceae bacterium]
MSEIVSAKKKLRRTIKAAIKHYNQDKTLAQEEAQKAANIFLCSSIFKKAKGILAYAATQNELSIDIIIQAALKYGKMVALPKTEKTTTNMNFFVLDSKKTLQEQLILGNFDIREPAPYLYSIEQKNLPSPTIILIPGVAFTVNGFRLGHGKGYYDYYLSSFLNQKKNTTVKEFVGCCYNQQIVKYIPTETHDISMDYILTPTDFLKCEN